MSAIFTACSTMFAFLLDLIRTCEGNDCLAGAGKHMNHSYANYHLRGILLMTRPAGITFFFRLDLSSQVTILNQSLGELFIA